MNVRCRNAANCCELTCEHIGDHQDIFLSGSSCMKHTRYFCGCNSEGEYVLDGRCIPVQSAAVLSRNDER